MLSNTCGLQGRSRVLGFHSNSTTGHDIICPTLRRCGKCKSYDKEVQLRHRLVQEKELELRNRAKQLYAVQVETITSITDSHDSSRAEELAALTRNGTFSTAEQDKSKMIQSLVQEMKSEPAYTRWNVEADVEVALTQARLRRCPFSHRMEVRQAIQRARQQRKDTHSMLGKDHKDSSETNDLDDDVVKGGYSDEEQKPRSTIHDASANAEGEPVDGNALALGGKRERSDAARVPQRTAASRVWCEERARVFRALSPFQRCVACLLWQQRIVVPQHVLSDVHPAAAATPSHTGTHSPAAPVNTVRTNHHSIPSQQSQHGERLPNVCNISDSPADMLVSHTVWSPALGWIDLSSLPRLVSFVSQVLSRAPRRRVGAKKKDAATGCSGSHTTGSDAEASLLSMRDDDVIHARILEYFTGEKVDWVSEVAATKGSAHPTPSSTVTSALSRLRLCVFNHAVWSEKEIDLAADGRSTELMEVLEWILYVYQREHGRRVHGAGHSDNTCSTPCRYGHARAASKHGCVVWNADTTDMAQPTRVQTPNTVIVTKPVLRALTMRRCNLTSADAIVAALHHRGLHRALLALDLSENTLHSMRFLFALRARFADRLLRLSLRDNPITNKPEYEEQVRRLLPRLTSLDDKPIRRPALRLAHPRPLSYTLMTASACNKSAPATADNRRCNSTNCADANKVKNNSEAICEKYNAQCEPSAQNTRTSVKHAAFHSHDTSRPGDQVAKAHPQRCSMNCAAVDTAGSAPMPDAELQSVLDCVSRLFYIWECRCIPHTPAELRAFARESESGNYSARRKIDDNAAPSNRTDTPHNSLCRTTTSPVDAEHTTREPNDPFCGNSKGDCGLHAETTCDAACTQHVTATPPEEEMNEDNFPHRYLHPSVTFTLAVSPDMIFFDPAHVRLDREVAEDSEYTGMRLSALDMRDLRTFDVALKNSSRNLLLGRPALQRFARGAQNCFTAYACTLYPERMQVQHHLGDATVSVVRLPSARVLEHASKEQTLVGTSLSSNKCNNNNNNSSNKHRNKVYTPSCAPAASHSTAEDEQRTAPTAKTPVMYTSPPSPTSTTTRTSDRSECAMYVVTLHGTMSWRLPSMRDGEQLVAHVERVMTLIEQPRRAGGGANAAWERRRRPALQLCNDAVYLRPLTAHSSHEGSRNDCDSRSDGCSSNSNSSGLCQSYKLSSANSKFGSSSSSARSNRRSMNSDDWAHGMNDDDELNACYTSQTESRLRRRIVEFGLEACSSVPGQGDLHVAAAEMSGAACAQEQSRFHASLQKNQQQQRIQCYADGAALVRTVMERSTSEAAEHAALHALVFDVRDVCCGGAEAELDDADEQQKQQRRMDAEEKRLPCHVRRASAEAAVLLRRYAGLDEACGVSDESDLLVMRARSAAARKVSRVSKECTTISSVPPRVIFRVFSMLNMHRGVPGRVLDTQQGQHQQHDEEGVPQQKNSSRTVMLHSVGARAPCGNSAELVQPDADAGQLTCGFEVYDIPLDLVHSVVDVMNTHYTESVFADRTVASAGAE